jgi:hypothetical protein
MKIRVRGEVLSIDRPRGELQDAAERQFSADSKDSTTPRRPPTPAEINKKNQEFWDPEPAA